MGQQTRTRQQQIITMQADSMVTSNPLGLGMLYREIMLTLRGTIQAGSQAFTAANVLGGDEWALLRKIELTVNGGDVVRSFTGEQLRMMNAFWYDRPARISPAWLGSPTTGVAFDSTLILPFWDQWGRSPIDTLLDSSKLSDLRIQSTFGNVTHVTSLTAGSLTVTPTLMVTSRECFGIAGNFSVARQFQIQAPAAVAAQDDYVVTLPLGNIYKGFWINTKDASGNDLAACIDRVKLTSGTNVYIDSDFRVYRDWQNLRNSAQIGSHDTTKAVIPLGFSAKTLTDGWTYIALVDDGYLTEAIDTYTLSELLLRFKVNQTITTLTVIPDQLIPVRDNKKAG